MNKFKPKNALSTHGWEGAIRVPQGQDVCSWVKDRTLGFGHALRKKRDKKIGINITSGDLRILFSFEKIKKLEKFFFT